MPEYGSTIILLFILASCFYKKHVRDWWWFRLGVICYLGSFVLGGIGSFSSAFSSWNMPYGLASFLGSVGGLAAIGAFVIACTKKAELETQHLRCLECGYILKGLSEPRCPECGRRI